MRTGLIAGFTGLVVVLIFIIQNAHAVDMSFLGAHLRLSLAVALLFRRHRGRCGDGRRRNRPDHPAPPHHPTRPPRPVTRPY
jgi:hypothetical protein